MSINLNKCKALLACVTFALAVPFSGAASASLLNLTLKTSSNVVIDSFTLDSAAGRPDSAGTPPYVLFDITNDLLGFDALFFGDASTGGWMGLGYLCCGGSLVSQVIDEYFSPALYSGVGLSSNLVAGSSYTAASGHVLEVSAVPEPATLALLGLGLAGFGFARRQQKQTA